MNTEFFEAVKILEKEKGVPAELLYEKIQTAIIVAVRKNYTIKMLSAVKSSLRKAN